MLSYFTILKHHFTIIPYHFPISSTSQNSIFIKILFFNHSLLFISNRYIFSDCWKLLHFFHLFVTVSPMLSVSFSLYFFRLLELLHFFHLFFTFSPMLSVTFSLYFSDCWNFFIFFTFSPMLSVTFSLPLHFPFSMPDCLSSLWVSLVLTGCGWAVDRGSLRWIVDRFSVSFNFVGF